MKIENLTTIEVEGGIPQEAKEFIKKFVENDFIVVPTDMYQIKTENDINNLVNKIYQQNVFAGWHSKPREIGTCLMLIVSEIAEAMEGDRKSLMDDHLPHRSMLEVELADAVIRIMDLSGREGLDLGGAIVEKLEYNKTRADHKLENREKEGGKKY